MCCVELAAAAELGWAKEALGKEGGGCYEALMRTTNRRDGDAK